MDPFSITVGCMSLLEAVVKASTTIGTFVKNVRQARRAMEAVSRELLSLKIVLELLIEDTQDKTVVLPQTLNRQVASIVANCTIVVLDIEKCMEKYMQRNIAWASNGQEEVAQLLRGLEAHKAALELGLDTLTFHLAKEIKADTQDILHVTGHIREDTTQILAEIEKLKARLRPGTSETTESDIILQRYLEELTFLTENDPTLPKPAESSFSGSTTPSISSTISSPPRRPSNPDGLDNQPGLPAQSQSDPVPISPNGNPAVPPSAESPDPLRDLHSGPALPDIERGCSLPSNDQTSDEASGDGPAEKIDLDEDSMFDEINGQMRREAQEAPICTPIVSEDYYQIQYQPNVYSEAVFDFPRIDEEGFKSLEAMRVYQAIATPSELGELLDFPTGCQGQLRADGKQYGGPPAHPGGVQLLAVFKRSGLVARTTFLRTRCGQALLYVKTFPACVDFW
ncbi:hypothetical protein QBC47DRAFT_366316 [Echria macrotheca]|uniref:Azaphilone pigments biosynthesis cluster protein L N-terminal domain-containing protein n=1 Tax=Echria macrotheca TaxID=438768 RepID=A0AAJ0FAF9_9PEZI|nr:hypothetical protein QBC47DRAFT_366316 [Echria macrotheca]